MVDINKERLWDSLMEMSEIGRQVGGGCTRLALSDEDRAGRELFTKWAREAGAEVQSDVFGNVFAFRAGNDPARPQILTGSHLDTQPGGGYFDGAFGVLSGLELLRAMNDEGITTNAPIAVVNWTNEEGVRYSPGLTGSTGFAGLMDEETILNLTGIDGSRYGTELERIGYAGMLRSSNLNFGFYVEAHIEQGPVLERKQKPIGVVKGIQGVRWYELHVKGVSGHAGTTPMASRKDAFMASAAIAVRLKAAASVYPDLRLTCGRISLSPGSPNTIPGETSMSLDLRHPDETILKEFERSIHQIAHDVSKDELVEAFWTKTMEVPAVDFDENCVEAIRCVTTDCKLEFERIASGAMHDASNIARIVPTGMIFVPCRNGISHHRDEWVEPQQIADGATVLANTIIKLAS